MQSTQTPGSIFRLSNRIQLVQAVDERKDKCKIKKIVFPGVVLLFRDLEAQANSRCSWMGA